MICPIHCRARGVFEFALSRLLCHYMPQNDISKCTHKNTLMFPTLSPAKTLIPCFYRLTKENKKAVVMKFSIPSYHIFLNKQNSAVKEGIKKAVLIWPMNYCQNEAAAEAVPFPILKLQHNDWATGPKNWLAKMSSCKCAERCCTLQGAVILPDM